MKGIERPLADAGWLLAALAFAGLTAARVLATARGLASPADAMDLAGSLVAIVLIATGGAWLTLGAWRRTTWGGRRDRLRARPMDEPP